jgi:hypothetical protein
MRKSTRIASLVLFLALSLFLLLFGLLYATVREPLWFHAAAAPKEALDAARPLYFALMKLIGGASVALALITAYVALVPLRKGVDLAGRALFIAHAMPLMMAAYVAETLAAETGAPTSWHIMGALLAVDIAALAAHGFGRTSAN